jgi:hypothetical protein
MTVGNESCDLMTLLSPRGGGAGNKRGDEQEQQRPHVQEQNAA